MHESIIPVSHRLAKGDPKAFVAHFKAFFALWEEEMLRYRIPGIGGARGSTVRDTRCRADDYRRERLREIKRLN